MTGIIQLKTWQVTGDQGGEGGTQGLDFKCCQSCLAGVLEIFVNVLYLD